MSKWQDRHSAIMSVYLVLRRRDEVLLLLRKNTGYCDGQYGLPAGHVDGSETLHQAMVREAKEEAGVLVAEENLNLIHVMHRMCRDHERVDFFFECLKWKGEPKNAEPHKCEKLSWFHLEDMPDNVIDYYSQMFFKVKDGEMLSYSNWDKKV